MDYSVSSTPAVIQHNQIELIEAAKETNTHSFGSSGSTVKIQATDTSVKNKISLAQKMPLMKQQYCCLI